MLLTVSGCKNVEKDPDAIEYTLSKDKTYYILSYVGENIEELVIPEYYNGKPVLEIGKYACYESRGPHSFNQSKLKSVKIEAKLTKIGNSAFEECSFLETINIPPTVTEMGEGAFSQCESLKSIEIPTGVTRISRSLFYNCKELDSIKLHDRIERIDSYAFHGCSSIDEIILPEKVKWIGENTFSMMESLKRIYIPEGNKYYVTVDGNLYTKDQKTLIQ